MQGCPGDGRGGVEERPRFRLDRMGEEDLSRVLEIERASFPDPWSHQSFLHEIQGNPFAINTVVRDTASSERVIGYSCLWALEGELQINNIAIDPEHRRKGLGRLLLRAALEEGTRRGCRLALLQVRPSNQAALSLYRSLGFLVAGRRRRYYGRSGEDALVMIRPLAPPAHE